MTEKKESRSSIVKKNILASFGLKAVNILTSLALIPLTIDYVNPTRNGIWLTLSSIIVWFGYFDLGLAHGFRNKFAEARALGNNELARKYVSTTYFVLTIIFLVVGILLFWGNHYLNWSNLLNIDQSYNEELRKVFYVIGGFFCIKIVFNVTLMLFTADQKPALADFIRTLGQVLALLAIFILTKTTEGNLVYLAYALSGVPALIFVASTVFAFLTERYKYFTPRLAHVHLPLVKDILGLGWKFFVILVSTVFIFQFINIILNRQMGPDAVTQYNVAFKYFSVINMVSVIILTPFWSAFTDAYTKKDFLWMKKVLHKLEMLWLVAVAVAILMVVVSPFAYEIWIGDKVTIPLVLSIMSAIFVLSQTLSTIYMYLINGIGKVLLQLIIYVAFAVVSVPLLSYFCDEYGFAGILFIPTLVYLIQAIAGRIQLTKLIHSSAHGIWDK